MRAEDVIPAGAMPVAVMGEDYCCPFGSVYGFGAGANWYQFPQETAPSDARVLGRALKVEPVEVDA